MIDKDGHKIEIGDSYSIWNKYSNFGKVLQVIGFTKKMVRFTNGYLRSPQTLFKVITPLKQTT